MVDIEEFTMEESLFIRELGIKSPMLKVLDFLMDNESFDYSRSEIEKGVGLSKTTLLKVWPKLEALELIENTRTVSKAKMYKLNKQNPIINKLMALDDAISEYYAQKCCNPEVNSDSEIPKIIDQNKGLIESITEYEKDSSDDRKDRSKELLAA